MVVITLLTKNSKSANLLLLLLYFQFDSSLLVIVPFFRWKIRLGFEITIMDWREDAGLLRQFQKKLPWRTVLASIQSYFCNSELMARRPDFCAEKFPLVFGPFLFGFWSLCNPKPKLAAQRTSPTASKATVICFVNCVSQLKTADMEILLILNVGRRCDGWCGDGKPKVRWKEFRNLGQQTCFHQSSSPSLTLSLNFIPWHNGYY